MTTTDTALTAPETISGMLYWGAQRWPDRRFVTLPDGSTWTRQQALDEARQTAEKLYAAGIRAGDRVFVMLPNSTDWLRCWWGLALLGGVIVPINPAFRGKILDDIIARLDPKAIVVEKGGEDRFTAEERRRALFLADLPAPSGLLPADVWAEPSPLDLHAIIMTSGTTGVSKGTMMSNRQLCRQASWLVEGAGVSESDVLLSDMPLFHLSGISPIALMMRVGGAFALRERASMTNYWQIARDLGATFSYIVGTMGGFLMSKPESPEERDHSLRLMLCAPTPPDSEAFKRRFGIDGIVFCYGSSEVSIVVVQPADVPQRAGSCGMLRDGYEVRLFDADGHDVPDGQPGELVVRNPTPGTMTLGYFGNPEATEEAWQGGWFHTGDLMRRDADGYFFWMDRVKDSIRRRGENISSFEVEREVVSHPAVLEAACVAVPSEYGGDFEVKVFIVPKPDMELDFTELVVYLANRLPYFMVPRFCELISELPKTASNRVQKFLIRDMGNTDKTWDREASGLTIGRDGQVQRATEKE